MGAMRSRVRLVGWMLVCGLLSLWGAERAMARMIAYDPTMRPPPPPVVGAPDVAAVRAVLGRVDPRVEECGRAHGTTGAVRINVFLYPDGQWSVAFGRASTPPPPGARGNTPFEVCIADVLASELGGMVQPFAGTRARKVSRTIRIVDRTATVGPEVRRALTAHRAALRACFPAIEAGARSRAVDIAVRIAVSADGVARLAGARVPPPLDFASVARCMEADIATIRVAGAGTALVIEGTVPVRIAVPRATAGDAESGTGTGSGSGSGASRVGEGGICGYGRLSEHVGEEAPQCQAGLSCCYPCGIEGCDSICMRDCGPPRP